MVHPLVGLEWLHASNTVQVLLDCARWERRRRKRSEKLEAKFPDGGCSYAHSMQLVDQPQILLEWKFFENIYTTCYDV